MRTRAAAAAHCQRRGTGSQRSAQRRLLLRSSNVHLYAAPLAHRGSPTRSQLVSASPSRPAAHCAAVRPARMSSKSGNRRSRLRMSLRRRHGGGTCMCLRAHACARGTLEQRVEHGNTRRSNNTVRSPSAAAAAAGRLAHRIASSVRPSWKRASARLAAAKLNDGASCTARPKQRSASAHSARPAAHVGADVDAAAAAAVCGGSASRGAGAQQRAPCKQQRRLPCPALPRRRRTHVCIAEVVPGRRVVRRDRQHGAVVGGRLLPPAGRTRAETGRRGAASGRARRAENARLRSKHAACTHAHTHAWLAGCTAAVHVLSHRPIASSTTPRLSTGSTLQGASPMALLKSDSASGSRPCGA